MAQILLPELGEGITSVEISDVSVKVGDNLSKDDILIVVETDKEINVCKNNEKEG